MSFDRMPGDAELTCLLGEPDCGPVQEIEGEESIVVGPKLVPMRFVVPWMVFVGVVITCMLFFMPRIELGNPAVTAFVFWLTLFALWFLSLPGVVALIFVMNRAATKKGSYFKVDTVHRTLEICPLHRTFKSHEIVAFTLLTRWYRYRFIPWGKTHQTSVLVRGVDNKVELYPVVRELAENAVWRKEARWAERLAKIFQVPLRRIILNKAESKALNDC